jgi:hypothetical protein
MKMKASGLERLCDGRNGSKRLTPRRLTERSNLAMPKMDITGSKHASCLTGVVNSIEIRSKIKAINSILADACENKRLSNCKFSITNNKDTKPKHARPSTGIKLPIRQQLCNDGDASKEPKLDSSSNASGWLELWTDGKSSG